MKIGILKETQNGENRVSLSPNISKQLIDKGFKVLIEKQAGINSSYQDTDYIDSGALIEKRGVVFKEADLLIKINPFDEEDLKLIDKGQILITKIMEG